MAVSVRKVAIFSRVPETPEILDRNRQFVDLPRINVRARGVCVLMPVLPFLLLLCCFSTLFLSVNPGLVKGFSPPPGGGGGDANFEQFLETKEQSCARGASSGGPEKGHWCFSSLAFSVQANSQVSDRPCSGFLWTGLYRVATFCCCLGTISLSNLRCG